MQDMSSKSSEPIMNVVIDTFDKDSAKEHKSEVQWIPVHSGIPGSEAGGHDAHHTRPCRRVYLMRSGANTVVDSTSKACHKRVAH